MPGNYHCLVDGDCTATNENYKCGNITNGNGATTLQCLDSAQCDTTQTYEGIEGNVLCGNGVINQAGLFLMVAILSVVGGL